MQIRSFSLNCSPLRKTKSINDEQRKLLDRILAQCSPRGRRRKKTKTAEERRDDFASRGSTKMAADCRAGKVERKEIEAEEEAKELTAAADLLGNGDSFPISEAPSAADKESTNQLGPAADSTTSSSKSNANANANANSEGGLLRLWENLKSPFRPRDQPKRAAAEKEEKEDQQSRKKGNNKLRHLGSRQSQLAAPLASIEEMTAEESGTTTAAAMDLRSQVVEEAEEQFVVFCVRIHLREGHGLAVRDASGSSDPYVKCLYAGQTLYRSETVFRELNPNWDEEFAFLVQDPTEDLTLKVFDYDRFMKDDFMGAANIALSTLALFQKTDLKLPLADPLDQCPEPYLGYLLLSVTLTPLTKSEKETFLERSVRGILSEQSARRGHHKMSTAILSRVNILLVQASLTTPLRASEPPDTHAKFRLGTEKFKSKSVARSWTPQWLEQFELHVFDEHFQTLDLSIWDNRSSAIIGKCSIDLTDFVPGRTVEQWRQLEAGAGRVHLLLTISSSSSSSSAGLAPIDSQQQQGHIGCRYNLWRSLHSLHDIGCLTVKIHQAEGLAAADLNGKSDPFCVVELVNLRAQTQTEYKTLSPSWEREFTFFVKDVHESVELTVFDEDPNKRAEFLGKLAIPLLKIRNGERRWYALKNRKLSGPAKGRILVEASLHFNYFKAALRTFKPRERKLVRPVERFKRSKFLANINRLRAIADQMAGAAKFVKSCLSWESYPKSIGALSFYILFISFVQLWHFPLLLLLLFLRSYSHKRFSEHFNAWTNRRNKRSHQLVVALSADGSNSVDDTNSQLPISDEGENEEDQMDDEDFEEYPTLQKVDQQKHQPIDGEESKSLKGRLQAVQETLLLIQNKSDFLLGLLDRVRNTFNFSVPFLSFLAIVVLCLATILLCLVPLRWILLVWGINKFSKKLRDPNHVDNNELLDFLSRIPTDTEMREFRNLSTRSSAGGSSTAASLPNGSATFPQSQQQTIGSRKQQ